MDSQAAVLLKEQFSHQFGMNITDIEPIADFFIALVENGKPLDLVHHEMVEMMGEIYNPEVGAWGYTLVRQGPAALATPQWQQTPEAVPEASSDFAPPSHQDAPAPHSPEPLVSAFAESSRFAQPPTSSATDSSRPVASRISIVGSGHGRSPRSGPVRRDADRALHTKTGGRVSKQVPHRSMMQRVGGRVGSPDIDAEAFGGPMGFPRAVGREHDGVRSQSRRKARCPEWPKCTNPQTCTYHHPTRLCSRYPDCPYTAAACDYVHPEISTPAAPVSVAPVACRFGAHCTNPHCRFAHPAPAAAHIGQAPVCMYHPNCLRPGCTFTHPGRSETTVDKIPIFCRDGADCKRPGCHFTHPGEKTIKCKHNVYCVRKDCPYEHDRPASGDADKTHISDRPFAGAAEETMAVDPATASMTIDNAQ
ncbi:hypothetical protein IWQ60_007991 [Tieghemiomyces parasiticus]|uniref:Uncharacterized protein n=1 Tax=Tieghemiomyces parasiticus TaxID=78921 RepID=A0A9W8DSG5_9FUNG|nr:hypothetical protein IWQ60_007991 [Tieghemiomyces parasiticus]